MNDNRPFFIFCLAVFVTAALLYGFQIGGAANELFENVVYLIPPILAVSSGIRAVKTYGAGNIHGHALLFFTIGLGCFLTGELLFGFFELILHIDPFPSVADGFYLFSYPFLFIGLIKEIQAARIVWKRITGYLIGMSLVTLMLALAVLYFGIYLAYDPAGSGMENAIAISYGIADLVILVPIQLLFAVYMEYRGGKIATPWLSVFIGATCILIADILFAIFHVAYEQNVPLYQQIDLFWIAGYLFISCGLYAMATLIQSIRHRFSTKGGDTSP